MYPHERVLGAYQTGIHRPSQISRPSTAQSASGRVTRQGAGVSNNNDIISSYHESDSGLVDLVPQARGQNDNTQVPGDENRLDSARMESLLRTQEERMNSFLHEARSRDEAQKFCIQQVLEHGISRVVTTIKDGVNHIFGHPPTHQVVQLQGQVHHLYQEKMRLESQTQHLLADNGTMQKQLKETKDKLTKALAERDEQRRLDDGATLADSAKATDDVVQSMWKQLNYNICSLAKLLAKYSHTRPADEITKERLRSIVSGWSRLLGDEDFRDFVIQSYLWILVDEQVFDGECGVWGGDHGHHLKSMREAIIGFTPATGTPGATTPSLRHAARWFAQGSAFLEHFLGNDKKAFRDLVTTEARRLKSFCLVSENSADQADKSIREELKTILELALKLDRMFMGSKALFVVRWPADTHNPTKPLHFNKNMMEALAWDKDLSHQSQVRFAVSPAL
ncbi:hypothetical protein FZEAL_7902 [Fusarium zealandicum]|uniref:Uncharacterized protein n=1 Tax=Fusarium zealandicum TaxID=1053134 RepID=A0A8H4UFI3_9HYPO|nr:hypothetical protein FZEAL_7902 [Fusarium zealandicum]